MEFKVLSEILDNLPVVTDINDKTFVPKFDYGTQADLLKFLSYKKKGKTKTNTYPLVWIQTPVPFTYNGPHGGAELTFILATNTSRDISNRQRTMNSFIQILEPLKESVIKAINAHDGTRISIGARICTKYFNYENDTEKGASDIWDALSFKVDFEINLDCIN